MTGLAGVSADAVASLFAEARESVLAASTRAAVIAPTRTCVRSAPALPKSGHAKALLLVTIRHNHMLTCMQNTGKSPRTPYLCSVSYDAAITVTEHTDQQVIPVTARRAGTGTARAAHRVQSRSAGVSC